MTAYYNEIDPYSAQWLRNLIKAGHIAPGDVDERSIEDVKPNDLRGYTQCHFFAGVGVWSYALRLAGWDDGRSVWTGSCPCQPFSAAGKGAGFSDERHLWPAFYHLIKECKPTIVFAEQVASKAVEPWIDLVHADLETVGYAFGCIAFPSASVGAPHIRDRAYWVADSIRNGSQGRLSRRQDSQREIQHGQTGRDGAISRMADASSDGCERQWTAGATQEGLQPQPECIGKLPDGFEGHGFVGGLADTNIDRCIQGIEAATTARHGYTSDPNGFWSNPDWVKCRDGKLRPVESGTFPLAPRTSNHVGRLRAYGNAINAEAAKEFIAAFMGVENE